MVICCPEQFDRMSIYDLKMVCKLGHPGCEVPGHPFEIYEGRRLLQQAAIEEEENRLREEAEALNRLREEAPGWSGLFWLETIDGTDAYSSVHARVHCQDCHG
jgi:hypothetical protein